MKANFAMAIAIVLYALMSLATSAELQNETSGLQAEELATGLLQDTYNNSLELNGLQPLAGMLLAERPPQKMPLDLPIPDGARIMESEIQEDTGIFVILDVPMTPDLTLDFYRKRLASQNWTEIPGLNLGFADQGVSSANFCQGPNNSSLTVTATPQENGTDLCLSIMSDPDYSFCSQGPGYYDGWLSPIPMLTTPNGTRILNSTSMAGPGNLVSVSAALETEMNSSSLTAHYADQLKAANWTMMGEGESGPSSWCCGNFEDENGRVWDGMLMSLELPGSDAKQRFVLMQATYNNSLYLNRGQPLAGMLLAERPPQKMPLDLPIPDGARIMGGGMEDNPGISVFLDVPMTPDLTLDFYRQHLASQNWTELKDPSMNRGFVEQRVSGAIFCQGLKNSSLIVSASPEENGTFLYMDIMSDTDHSFCSQGPSYFDDWLNPLPMLAAPNGTIMLNGNSMGGPGSILAISANLETEMNSSSLTAYYADQLKAANWTMMDEGESGPSSWSSWRFEDLDGQAWDGFLMALELPGTDKKQRFVLMQANREDNYLLDG